MKKHKNIKKTINKFTKKHKIKKTTKKIIKYEQKYIKHPNVLLAHPMKKNTFWKSSPFGIRYNKIKKKYEMHGGIDLAAPEGTPVYAAEEGRIIETSVKTSGFGKSIVIEHQNNVKTRYAHLSKILVEEDQYIQQGEIIGLVGSTGNTRGRVNAAHLHFEILINDKKYNPILHIKKPTK